MLSGEMLFTIKMNVENGYVMSEDLMNLVGVMFCVIVVLHVVIVLCFMTD